MHDVTRDPPFSKINLVMCRNLLIYFNVELQMKVFNSLTFALRNEGLLFLGSSESLGDFEGNYKTLSREYKIFKKTFSSRASFNQDYYSKQLANAGAKYQLEKNTANKELNLHEVLLDSLAEYFLPLSVLVNESLNVIYSREKNPYLTLPAGTSSLQILKMVPPELELELRTAIHQANRENSPQVTPYIHVAVDADSATSWVRVIVIPIAAKYQQSRLMVISFQNDSPEHMDTDLALNAENEVSQYTRQLEAELKKTKYQLQSVIEELETSNEELQATNEELQSSNEELQSTNEELETTNEELQSTNEEVQVAYNELKVVSEETERQKNIAESAKQALEIERSLLEGVSNSSNSGVMAFQAVRDDTFDIIDFEWMLVNSKAEEIVNRKADDLIGKKLLEQMPGNKSEGLFDIYKNVTMTRESVEREFFYEHEGLNHWFYQSIVPYLDGFVVSFTDITEKKQQNELLKLHEERLRLATQAADIGIWEWSLKTQKLSCNQVMLEQMGLPATANYIRVDDWKAFIHPDDQETFGQLLQKVLDNNEEFDAVYRSNSDEIQHFHAQAQTIRNDHDEVIKVIGVNLNITDQVFYQDALKDVKNRALAASKEKSQFIASISHEIRTPLHAILNFSNLGGRVSDSDKAAHYFDNIHISADRLTTLIDNLLDFSKLESGKMQVNCIEADIVALARECANEIESLLLDKNLSVMIADAGEIVLRLDVGLIKQVFINLLSNAIKFSVTGGVIHVDFKIIDNPMRLAKQTSKLVSVQVIDQGCGIPPSEIETIFGLFSQSSQTQKTHKGTGLGLPISREIIQLLDGRIWAESPPKGEQSGTAIIFQLPLPDE